MSKISDSTKEKIKKLILEKLGNQYQSTYRIAEKIGRSWKLTLNLLLELKKEKKVEESRIANLRVWKK